MTIQEGIETAIRGGFKVGNNIKIVSVRVQDGLGGRFFYLIDSNNNKYSRFAEELLLNPIFWEAIGNGAFWGDCSGGGCFHEDCTTDHDESYIRQSEFFELIQGGKTLEEAFNEATL